MATKATSGPSRPKTSAHSMGSDITTLQHLPPASLHALVNLVSDKPSPSPAPLQSAVEELKAFTPSTATPDQSLRLSNAYLKDMRSVRDWEDGRLEKLGEGVDKLRRNGEEARDALADVKL